MAQKDKSKIEPSAATNTLSDSEREGLDVKNNESKIRLQAKGVYFGIVVLIVVFLAIGITWLIRGPLLGLFESSSGIVARVGNKVVTKDDYNAFAPAYTKFVQYGDGSKISDVEAKRQALNFLIDEKALEIESEKTGIKVDEDDVNKVYQGTVTQLGGEAIYAAGVKSMYGWTPELTKRTIRKNLLEKKLASKLIAGRYVYGSFVRWDYDGDGIPAEQLAQAKEGARKALETIQPLYNRGASQEEISKAMVKLRNDNLQWRDNVVGVNSINISINDETAKEIFHEPQDWQSISKLNKIGQDTGVVESAAGYFFIYRLTRIDKGRYNSWSDFYEQAEKKAKIYSYGQTAKSVAFGLLKSTIGEARAQSLICRDSKKGKLSIIQRFLGVGIAGAEGPINCGNHWSQVWGTVLSGATWLPIPSARVDFAASDRTPTCRPVPSEGETDWEAFDFTVYTNSGGTFVAGPEPTGSSRKISCWTRWNTTISAAGYKSASWNDYSVGPNGSSLCLDRSDPAWTPPKFFGSYPNLNTDGNCQLFLEPNLPPPPPAYGNVQFISKLTDPYYSSSSYYGDECLIGGWAVDGSAPKSSIPIDIYFDSDKTAGASATVKVPAADKPWKGVQGDLSKYGIDPGPDNGPGHGFFIKVPDHLRDGKSHFVYAGGIRPLGNWWLSGSPLSFTCMPEPKYYPWLQSLNGDVVAGGNITGQKIGVAGSRSASAIDKEASYLVIISAISKSGNDFCSTNAYSIGDLGINCKASTYAVNSKYMDYGSVASGVEQLWNKNGAGAGGICTTGMSKYLTGNLSSSGVNLNHPGGNDLSGGCANGKIWKATGDYQLGDKTFDTGRATYWVDGNLALTGNILASLKSNYGNPKDVPSLGIIVDGDITIDPNVTEIDASLFATGKIYTCHPAGLTTSGTAYYRTNGPICKKSLSVNGLMSAIGGFTLGRTYITNFSGGSGSPAEKLVASAQAMAFPPPGFGDDSSVTIQNFKYLGEAAPRF